MLYVEPQPVHSCLTDSPGTIDRMNALLLLGALALGAVAVVVGVTVMRSERGRSGFERGRTTVEHGRWRTAVNRRLNRITLAVGFGAAALTLGLAAWLPGSIRGQSASPERSSQNAGLGEQTGDSSGDEFQPPSDLPLPAPGEDGGNGFASGGS